MAWLTGFAGGRAVRRYAVDRSHHELREDYPVNEDTRWRLALARDIHARLG
jgi:hypothetical protein